MPALQSLKKQLRGIRSTQKLTKAMKTISTVKFAKLNTFYGKYADYGRECRAMYEQYSAGFSKAVAAADAEAPAVYIVMAGNKGLCGNFNAEVLNYARETLGDAEPHLLIACGKKAITYLKEKNFQLERECVFSDVPTFEEGAALLDELIEWRKSGKVSKVYVIYPRYRNMMLHTPTVCDLFEANDGAGSDPVLFVPDRDTIVEKTAKTVFHALFYQLMLETALGAQAATLMTMRSAYDTATDLCVQLEGKINRNRQSAVTADVLETSTEWKE